MISLNEFPDVVTISTPVGAAGVGVVIPVSGFVWSVLLNVQVILNFLVAVAPGNLRLGAKKGSQVLWQIEANSPTAAGAADNHCASLGMSPWTSSTAAIMMGLPAFPVVGDWTLTIDATPFDPAGIVNPSTILVGGELAHVKRR